MSTPREICCCHILTFKNSLSSIKMNSVFSLGHGQATLYPWGPHLECLACWSDKLGHNGGVLILVSFQIVIPNYFVSYLQHDIRLAVQSLPFICKKAWLRSFWSTGLYNLARWTDTARVPGAARPCSRS